MRSPLHFSPRKNSTPPSNTLFQSTINNNISSLTANKNGSVVTSVQTDSTSVAMSEISSTDSTRGFSIKKLFGKSDEIKQVNEVQNVSTLHTEMVDATKLSYESPEDGVLATNAVTLKNKFERSLFTLTSRTGNNIKSNIWRHNYAKIINLSPEGEQMMSKSGK